MGGRFALTHRVKCYAVDVSDAAAMCGFARKALDAHPAIGLLSSDAGGLRPVDFTSETLQNQDLTADFRSNLDGVIHLVGGFLPGLRRVGKASIIIVSSGYALAPATCAPIYSASKAALHSPSKSLRRQLAPLNITVTEVAPPAVDTRPSRTATSPKMPARELVAQTLTAASRGVKEVYPGPARWLPLFLRIASSLMEGRELQRPERGTGALARQLSVKGHAAHESRACGQRCNVARHKPNRTEKLDCAR